MKQQSMLKLVSRNQQGQKATDFVFTRADGSQGRLYELKAPFVVIYFYNPGCSEGDATISAPHLRSFGSITPGVVSAPVQRLKSKPQATSKYSTKGAS